MSPERDPGRPLTREEVLAWASTPEVQESLRRAEHASAEGRTVGLDEVLARHPEWQQSLRIPAPPDTDRAWVYRRGRWRRIRWHHRARAYARILWAAWKDSHPGQDSGRER